MQVEVYPLDEDEEENVEDKIPLKNIPMGMMFDNVPSMCYKNCLPVCRLISEGTDCWSKQVSRERSEGSR
jgi:hypothetical protein